MKHSNQFPENDLVQRCMGCLIKTSDLKEIVDTKQIEIVLCTFNGEKVDYDPSLFDEDDIFVIARNDNSGTIRIILMFSDNRYIIETKTQYIERYSKDELLINFKREYL